MTAKDFLIIGLLAFATLLGFFAGVAVDREYMKSQAIDHNAAEYDQKTGVWRWKQ